MTPPILGREVLAGHAQRIAQPLTRRQRAGLALAAAVVAGVVLWAALRPGTTPTSGRGCVYIVIPSSTGGGVLHDCGAAARRLCRAQADAGGAFAADVRAQCRLAGLRPH